jgi:hypothetical protein
MARTPNLQPVLNALKAGKFDDRIDTIEKVIDARKKVLKKELEKEIRKLYGEGFEVISSSEATPTRLAGSPRASVEPTPHQAEELQVIQQNANAKSEDDEDFTENAEGFVSRSPIIGPIAPEELQTADTEENTDD